MSLRLVDSPPLPGPDPGEPLLRRARKVRERRPDAGLQGEVGHLREFPREILVDLLRAHGGYELDEADTTSLSFSFSAHATKLLSELVDLLTELLLGHVALTNVKARPAPGQHAPDASGDPSPETLWPAQRSGGDRALRSPVAGSQELAAGFHPALDEALLRLADRLGVGLWVEFSPTQEARPGDLDAAGLEHDRSLWPKVQACRGSQVENATRFPPASDLEEASPEANLNVLLNSLVGQRTLPAGALPRTSFTSFPRAAARAFGSSDTNPSAIL